MLYETLNERLMQEQLAEQKSKISDLEFEAGSIRENIWHIQVGIDTIDCELVVLQRLLMEFVNDGGNIRGTLDHIFFLLDSLGRYAHSLSEQAARIAESEVYRILASENFEIYSPSKAIEDDGQGQQSKKASAKAKGGR